MPWLYTIFYIIALKIVFFAFFTLYIHQEKDGKWGVINSKGEVILDPTYKIDLETPTFIGKYIFNGIECTNIDG